MPTHYMGLLSKTGSSQAKHVNHTLLWNTSGNTDVKPSLWPSWLVLRLWEANVKSSNLSDQAQEVKILLRGYIAAWDWRSALVRAYERPASAPSFVLVPQRESCRCAEGR